MTLAELEQEHVQLTRRLSEMSDSMRLLQGVVDAWERLNPERDAFKAQLMRIDQELRASEKRMELAPQRARAGPDSRATEAPPPTRGEITERVHRVLMTGTPLSPGEVHAAIDRRYPTAYSIGAVAMAMRRGAEGGRYLYNGKTGKYWIAG